jgi:hypothetical protein
VPQCNNISLFIYLYYLSRKHIRIKKITLINNIKNSEAVPFNKNSIFKIKTNIAFSPYKIVWEFLIAFATQQNRDSYFKKKNTCFKQKIA